MRLIWFIFFFFHMKTNVIKMASNYEESNGICIIWLQITVVPNESWLVRLTFYLHELAWLTSWLHSPSAWVSCQEMQDTRASVEVDWLTGRHWCLFLTQMCALSFCYPCVKMELNDNIFHITHLYHIINTGIWKNYCEESLVQPNW